MPYCHSLPDWAQLATVAFLSIDNHYSFRSMEKRARRDRETPTLCDITSCYLYGKPSNVTQQQLYAESDLKWLCTLRSIKHAGMRPL